MSDTSHAVIAARAPRRRRGPALRKHIMVDGKLRVPRDSVADEVGVHPRTAARKCTGVTYLGNVAYVEREQALRDLVGLNKPQRPTRSPRRGPCRTK
jgi:hypothetical protein